MPPTSCISQRSPPGFGQLLGMAWDIPNPPYIILYIVIYILLLLCELYVYIFIYIILYIYIYIYMINMCLCVDSWIRNGSSFGGLRNQQGTTTEVFIPLMFHPKLCEEWTASPRWYWSFVVGKPAPDRIISGWWLFSFVLPWVAAWKQTSLNYTEHLQKPDGVDISMWFLCISIKLFLKKRHKYKD